MIKTSNFTYQTSTGLAVEISVERIYGSRIDNVYTDDGTYVDIESFDDSYNIYVTFEKYGIKNQSTYIDKRGDYTVVVAEINRRQKTAIVMPDDIAKQVIEATKEVLSEEISSYDFLEIVAAKEAISTNKVLPVAELKAKREQYNNMFNDGGEGFNPYDDWMSAESVDCIKSKFPNKF